MSATVPPDSAPAEAVVILARGLGTRMRRDAGADADLTDDQRAAAASGLKAMMPIGRPFLDHCLSAYADAGITRACLVIGPEHQAVRDYYATVPTTRISVDFAVQAEPLGTADAVLAAEAFAGGERFVMVNGDNYYPAEVVRAVREAPGDATAGFDPDALVALSNIPPERIAAFALLDADADHHLVDIVEKPTPEQVAERRGRSRVSMNCFAFTPAIFDAARGIGPSARGEFEIVDAVRALVAAGRPVTVVDVAAGVLDLSSQGDVASVAAALEGREVRL